LTSGFDLTIGDPMLIHRFEGEGSKRDGRATLRVAFHATLLHFPVFGTFWL